MLNKLLFAIFILFTMQIQSVENDDEENPTQVEARQKRKWNLAFSDKRMNSAGKVYSFLINYNFAKKFSIGYRQMVKRKYEEKESLNINQSVPNVIQLSIVEEYNYLDLGILNLRYYFWDTVPFYFTGGIARTYTGYHRTTSTAYFRSSSNGVSLSYPTEYYVESKPHYSQMLGFGFQWLFESGLSFGIEYFNLRAMNGGGGVSRRQINYSPNLSATTIGYIYYYNNQRVNKHGEEIRYIEINVGYSF